ncbi:hypothetical protein [Haloarcula litorea]|uniref:hypothetical protein n=1 Tax=Haloarcula litorea TaxID=3032579 RepID=UPI0023E8C16A|nr:hypothetical protein [Halomicroarcula sp. GDY20]
MSPEPAVPTGPAELTSRAYHLTVDDGRDSFYALSIEAPDADGAWLASDTVRSLENMR